MPQKTPNPVTIPLAATKQQGKAVISFTGSFPVVLQAEVLLTACACCGNATISPRPSSPALLSAFWKLPLQNTDNKMAEHIPPYRVRRVKTFSSDFVKLF